MMPLKSHAEPVDISGEQNLEETSELGSQDLLDLSQYELIRSSKGGIGIGGGANAPWQLYSLSVFWPHSKSRHWNVSIGGGDFTLSSKTGGKTVNIETVSRSFLFSSRHYFTEFAPFFYEPLLGLSFWDGDIRPQGSDSVIDTAASSLSSDFSHRGITLGFKTGIQWWFQDHFVLELAILQFSYSFLIQESYTNNTHDVRQSVREQLQGPVSWSGINLKLAYSLR